MSGGGGGLTLEGGAVKAEPNKGAKRPNCRHRVCHFGSIWLLWAHAQLLGSPRFESCPPRGSLRGRHSSGPGFPRLNRKALCCQPLTFPQPRKTDSQVRTPAWVFFGLCSASVWSKVSGPWELAGTGRPSGPCSSPWVASTLRLEEAGLGKSPNGGLQNRAPD